MSRNVRQANGLDRYRSYDRPPEGFDPLTAPDELLLRHGLPRRPDPNREPELARIWERTFARPLRYSKADLAIDPWLSGRNPLQDKDSEFGPNNWAGATVRAGCSLTLSTSRTSRSSPATRSASSCARRSPTRLPGST